MSAKHTPGPWVANDLSQRVHTQDDVTITRCEPHSTAVAKANAHLIAAAPDLYEALDRLMEEVDDMTKRSGWFGYGARDAAKSALTKARGES